MSATESPKEWLGQVEFVAKNLQNFWTIGVALAVVLAGVLFSLDFLIWTLNFNLDGATFWAVYLHGNPEKLWGYEIVIWLVVAFVLGVWLFVYARGLFHGVEASQAPWVMWGHAAALWLYVAGWIAGVARGINPAGLILLLLFSPLVIPLLARGLARLGEWIFGFEALKSRQTLKLLGGVHAVVLGLFWCGNEFSWKMNLLIFGLLAIPALCLYSFLKDLPLEESPHRGAIGLFLFCFWFEVFLVASKLIPLEVLAVQGVVSWIAFAIFMLIEGFNPAMPKRGKLLIPPYLLAGYMGLGLWGVVSLFNYLSWENPKERNSVLSYKLRKVRSESVENPLTIHLIKNYPYAKDFAPQNQVVIENHLARVTPAKESANKAGVYRLELFDSHRLYFFYDSEGGENCSQGEGKTDIWLTRAESKGGEYKEELIKTTKSCDLGFKLQENQTKKQASPAPSGA